jgi:DNA-binding PadR family transcriptional regulator
MFCRMSNPFATETELLILGLLQRSAGLYGMELLHKSNGKLKRGTIYVTLGRLEERGLVTSELPKTEKHSGLPRPVYSVSEAGKRMLKAWQEIKGGNAT